MSEGAFTSQLLCRENVEAAVCSSNHESTHRVTHHVCRGTAEHALQALPRETTLLVQLTCTTPNHLSHTISQQLTLHLSHYFSLTIFLSNLLAPCLSSLLATSLNIPLDNSPQLSLSPTLLLTPSLVYCVLSCVLPTRYCCRVL